MELTLEQEKTNLESSVNKLNELLELESKLALHIKYQSEIKVKKVTKVSETLTDTKIDNLRISKTNEVKPEIKKVKKQETEKREFKIKDFIVYPKHGVGQITEFKKISLLIFITFGFSFGITAS